MHIRPGRHRSVLSLQARTLVVRSSLDSLCPLKLGIHLADQLPGRSPESSPDKVFFLPADAIAAIWIALALRQGFDWIERRLRYRTPALRPAMAGGNGNSRRHATLLAHFRSNDQSQNYLPRDWGENILTSLQERHCRDFQIPLPLFPEASRPCRLIREDLPCLPGISPSGSQRRRYLPFPGLSCLPLSV